jgi:hypothetical protein
LLIARVCVPAVCVPAGFFGAASGAVAATCSGPCRAGFFCPPGSVSNNERECGLGFFCPAQSAAPLPCPAGRCLAVCAVCQLAAASSLVVSGTFGAGTTLVSSTQCLACLAGWYCEQGASSVNMQRCPGNSSSPVGSVSPSACACPPGFFSSSGQAPCTGRYRSELTRSISRTYVSVCPPL